MSRPMKDSGVEWIGKVPESWNNKKLYNMFKIIGSGTTPKTSYPEFYDNGTIDWLNTGDLNNGYIIETKNKITEMALNNVSALKVYPKDSLVVAMYGATIGKLGITKIPVATNQACCVLAEPIDTDLKFIFYWLMGNQKEIVALGYGGGQPNISQQLIKNLRIPCPNVLKQQEISTFLDRKTAQIDSIIDDTKQSITEFKNYRQALITEAVTKGLNSDAKMKDSGIEWFGKVPETWSLNKLKRFFEIKKNIANNLGYDILSVTQKGLKVKDITSNEGQISADYSKYQIVEPHDFVMNHMDLLTGWVDCSVLEGVTSPDYRVFKAKNDSSVNNQYYNCLFQMCYTNKIFYGIGQGVSHLGRWRLQTDKFLNFILPIPPIQEQQQIAGYLDEKCAHIDSLIADKEKLVSEFETYKKALIFEYVTGKKEVE